MEKERGLFFSPIALVSCCCYTLQDCVILRSGSDWKAALFQNFHEVERYFF